MKEPDTIVAFFARGQELAYAVLEYGDLVRFGIKTTRGRRSGVAFESVVRRAFISVLGSSVGSLVVIEHLDGRRQLGGLSRALPRVVASALSGAVVQAARVRDAKRLYCGRDSATHADLRDAVLARHPVLQTCAATTATRVCLAVALGETALSRASGDQRPTVTFSGKASRT